MKRRMIDGAADHPWRFFWGYIAATTLIYQLALHVPITTPTVIPPLPWDASVPLLPWSAWLYMSYFFLMPSWVVATRRADTAEARRAGARLLLAGMAVVFGNLAINTLLPTEVGRTLSPDQAGGWPLSAIIEGDTPRAALPSGHVSLPAGLTALAFLGRLRARWGYAAWTVVLGVSVLTTRQHVLLDAVAGLAWGPLAAVLAHRLLREPLASA